MSFAYKITCTPTSQVYYGVSKSSIDTYNPFDYFLKCYQQDNTKYKSISESVLTHGRANHVFQRIMTPENFKSPSEFVAKLIELSEGKNLNDGFIVTDDKYTCEGCSKQVKVCFRKLHETKYCIKTLDGCDELAMYMATEIPPIMVIN